MRVLDRDEFVCSECGASFPDYYVRCPQCGVRLEYTDKEPDYIEELSMLDMILGDK